MVKVGDKVRYYDDEGVVTEISDGWVWIDCGSYEVYTFMESPYIAVVADGTD